MNMEIRQGVIIEAFQHLTPEDFSTILFALEQLRSKEENERLTRPGALLPQTELSHRAYQAYEKLTTFDDKVKLELGIRDFMIVPIAKYRLKHLREAIGEL